MVNYTQQTKFIINKKQDAINTAIALSDLLLSKLMYIPPQEVKNIEGQLLIFRSTLQPIEESYFIIESILAFLEYKQSNYSKVIEALLPIPEYSKAFNITHFATRCVAIATSYRSLGKKELALKYFQKAIEIYENVNLIPHQNYCFGLALYHISEIYGELKDYDEMLKRHLLFFKYSKIWKNIDFKNRSLNGIARAYSGKKDYDASLIYFKMASQSSEKDGNLPFKSRNYHDLGMLYVKMKYYDEAYENYNKALKLRQEYQLVNASITTLTSMGQLFFIQKKYDRAIELWQEALDMALPLKVNRKIYQIYKNLSTVYQEAGQFELALVFYKKFHLLKEQVDNVDKTQVESQKIREAYSQLRQQKELIESQKIEIEKALSKQEETIKYLENFASVAAHDLKAPIRIAANFAQLLKRKHKHLWDQDDTEYFDFISNNIGLLAKMIDDLLSLSRVDQNLPYPKTVDMDETLNAVLARLSAKIEESKANITIQSQLPPIIGHTSLVTQLFQNIIENAIKHRQTGLTPQISISSKLLSTTPQFCQFEIRDNGEGIETDLQPYIFELFSGGKKEDSSGIGLATCKKIVTHYGGNIWVKSKKNKQTSVFFTLPLVEHIIAN